MIALDEEISFEQIVVGVGQWYPGAIISVRDFRPHARQNVLPRGIRKAQVTLFLDDDIVAHFKQLAEQTPTTSVQAQINQALRAVVQQAQNQTTELMETKWLNSSSFIKLLDERINAVVADRTIAA